MLLATLQLGFRVLSMPIEMSCRQRSRTNCHQLPNAKNSFIHHCLSALLVCAGVLLNACGPPDFVAAETTHGSLHQRQGIWVLQLNGTPAQRGQATGELLGEQIRWLLPRYARATLGTEILTEKIRSTVALLSPHIPKAHLEQLRATATSSRVDEQLLLAVNLAPELYAQFGCSAIAVNADRSRDGQLQLGRNLDWYGGSILQHLGIIIIEHAPGTQPKNPRQPPKNAFAHVTWPGLVGVVTGMNQHGVSAANLVVLGKQAKVVPGTPVMFAMRSILEETDSAEKAVSLLRNTARTIPQNYLLADGTEAHAIETWVERFRPRSSKENGTVTIANGFDEETQAPRRGRYERMQAALHKKDKVNQKQVEHILKDVALGQMNVQAVIFTPASKTLHIATKPRPAAQGPYHQLALAPYFMSR